VAVPAGAVVTLVAVADAGSAFDAWLGCDDVEGASCQLRVTRATSVTASFVLSGEPPVGSLSVGFSGLPGPWSDAGYVTVRTPGGSDLPLFASGTLTDLPVGTYEVTAHALPICGVGYGPLRPTFDVEVLAGATATIDVAYATVTVSTLRFTARVTGVHSNAGPVEIFGTLVLEGSVLKTFACHRSWVDGSVTAASVRRGNVKDVYVEDAPVVVELTTHFDDTSCLEEDQPTFCTTFIDGTHLLTPEQVADLEAGRSYLHVNEPRGAAILAATSDPEHHRGGNVELIVDASSVDVAWHDQYDVCVGGVLWDDWDTFFDIADVCTSHGTLLFEDLYSGVHWVRISASQAASDALHFEGDGDVVTVRPGATSTLRVTVSPKD
jgi:hypothetical protein